MSYHIIQYNKMGTFISKLQYQVNKGIFYKIICNKGLSSNTFIVKLGLCIYTFGLHTYTDEYDTIRIAVEACCNYNKGNPTDIIIYPQYAKWNCTPQRLTELKKIENILKYDGGIKKIAEFVRNYIGNYPISL